MRTQAVENEVPTSVKCERRQTLRTKVRRHSITKLCVLAGLTAACLSARAVAQIPTLTTLYTFDRSSQTDGFQFPSELVQGSDGNFYGATVSGGAFGKGTIYRLTPAGALTTLHSFNGTDGSLPRGGLIQGKDGNFYGTTAGNSRDLPPTYGSVFKMAAGGALTNLHTFNSVTVDDDGQEPNARLTQGTDGNFYGTTSNGNGTIFRISPAGAFTTLHRFMGIGQESDGSLPAGALVQASDGNFYGTTSLGGTASFFGDGTFFKITPNGEFTTIYSFNNATDGGQGPEGIVLAEDGNFYGVTEAGGDYVNGGVPFKITPDGDFTKLFDINGGIDGSEPGAGLVEGSDGNFYGTTVLGGRGEGTIFRVTPTGVYTVLHTFNDDPGNPTTNLIEGDDGSFYGTSGFDGTVFKLTVPAATAGLQNISTRLQVGTGDNVSIAGFIVTGNALKKYIIRGLGPSLASLGVPSVLADPIVVIYRNDFLYADNNDWQDDFFKAQDIEATGIAPGKKLESAITGLLIPDSSAYTAILSGGNDGTGVGLIEAYDLQSNVDSELANISTRGFVGTGADVMIGGFIVGPAGMPPCRVLLRAIGPSLASSGIAGPLADPTLELHNGNGVLTASNDNWKTSQRAVIQATGIPPTNDKESAILATLAPGNYTAIVRGKNNTTGVALVEVYALH